MPFPVLKRSVTARTVAPNFERALDRGSEPVSHDGEGEYPSYAEPGERATLYWLIEALAFAGAGMAGVHVAAWLDPSNVSGGQAGRNEETSSRPHSRDRSPSKDGWPF